MFPSMPASVSPSLVDARADLDSIAEVVRRPDAVDGRAGRRRRGRCLPPAPRPDPRPQRDRFQPVQGGHDHAPAARPDERDRQPRPWPTTPRLVERDPDEYERLISSLLIKVTEFFRDPKVWDHLRDDVLPGLIDDARRVRAASSGSGPRAARRARRPTRWRSRSPRSSSGRAAGRRPHLRDRRRRRGDRVRPSWLLSGGRAQGRPGAAARAATSRRSGPGSRSSRALRSQMVFGEHDLSARVPFPRIDLAALPQRPDLLHAAAPAGRPRDVRLLVAARRPAGPRAVRDRGGVAGPV